MFDEDLRPSAPRVADDFALRVERAVVAIGSPFRDAIKMVYVEQVPVQIIGRRLGLSDAGPTIDQAHAEIGRRLR